MEVTVYGTVGVRTYLEVTGSSSQAVIIQAENQIRIRLKIEVVDVRCGKICRRVAFGSVILHSINAVHIDKFGSLGNTRSTNVSRNFSFAVEFEYVIICGHGCGNGCNGTFGIVDLYHVVSSAHHIKVNSGIGRICSTFDGYGICTACIITGIPLIGGVCYVGSCREGDLGTQVLYNVINTYRRGAYTHKAYCKQ